MSHQSLCLSVVCQLSVTLLHPVYAETWTFRQYFFQHHQLRDSVCIKILKKKNSKGSIVEVKWKGYENGVLRTIYAHGYNGRRIGTRMWSTEWCQFQWSWLTPNLDFKVTPVLEFNIAYNGTSIGVWSRHGRVVSVTGLGSRGRKVVGSNPGVARSDGQWRNL